jgi:hypothetical protein
LLGNRGLIAKNKGALHEGVEYALMYLVPISVIIGLVAGNLFIFLTPLLVFGLIPPAGPDCCQGHREPA